MLWSLGRQKRIFKGSSDSTKCFYEIFNYTWPWAPSSCPSKAKCISGSDPKHNTVPTSGRPSVFEMRSCGRQWRENRQHFMSTIYSSQYNFVPVPLQYGSGLFWPLQVHA
jgi:hypothetical protein